MTKQEHHNLFWLTHAMIEKALGAEGETSLIDYDGQTFEIKWEICRFSKSFLLCVKRQGSKLPGYFQKVESSDLIVPAVGYHLLLWEAKKTRGLYE